MSSGSGGVPATRARRWAARARHWAASRSRAMRWIGTGATMEAAAAAPQPISQPTTRWSISVTGVDMAARAKASMRVVPAATA